MRAGETRNSLNACWFCYQWNCREKLELEIFKLLLSYITTRILIYECDAVIKIIQLVFIFEAQFQINDLGMF